MTMRRPFRSITTGGLSVLAAAIVVVVAAGCAPAVVAVSQPTGVATAPASVAPTPTVTSTPAPTVDPDILFTVTATVTSPGKNGAVANLVQTVYAPRPATSVTTSDLARIKTQCDGLITTSANPTYLKTTVTSTLADDSSPWPSDDSVGVVEGGGNGSAWGGSFTPFETACAGPIITIPGEADGIAPIPSVKSASQPTGWTVGQYGFAYFYDADSFSDITKSERYKFSNCAIHLGPVAAQNPTAAKWPSEVAHQGPSGSTCLFGHL